MIAVQIIPDRFKQSEQNVLGDLALNGAAEPHIRRPTRGIQLKEETFAALRVVAGNGKTMNLIDAGSRRNVPTINGKTATDVYSNFFLQSIREDRAEKQQILETFGEPYIFLFGERARILTFTGILINTFDFNWEAEWAHNYDQYLRGTKCVENDARVFISYDETLVGGYILGSAWEKNSQERNFVNFQFQMFVTSYTNFSRLGDPKAYTGALPPQVQDGELSRAEARQFQPTLIDTSSQTGKVQDGVLKMPSLVEGLQAGLSGVRNAFGRAQQVTTNALQQLSNIAGGQVIRVPEGFAGTMEYDDSDQVVPYTGTTYGKIRYSVFSKNADEYVGFSDHYGSSSNGAGVVRLPSEFQQDGQRAVERAMEVWKKNGYVVPLSQSLAVRTAVGAARVGLLAAGATKGWSSAKGAVSTLLGVGRTRTAASGPRTEE